MKREVSAALPQTITTMASFGSSCCLMMIKVTMIMFEFSNKKGEQKVNLI